MSIFICIIHKHIHIYVYIYIERERDNDQLLRFSKKKYIPASSEKLITSFPKHNKHIAEMHFLKYIFSIKRIFSYLRISVLHISTENATKITAFPVRKCNRFF